MAWKLQRDEGAAATPQERPAALPKKAAPSEPRGFASNPKAWGALRRDQAPPNQREPSARRNGLFRPSEMVVGDRTQRRDRLLSEHASMLARKTFDPVEESRRYNRTNRDMKALDEQRAGGGTEFKNLTWDEYLALDPKAKAAVDVNSILQQAWQKDQDLLKARDANKDGKLSFSESGDEDFEGYKTRLDEVFGSDIGSQYRAQGRSMAYAPNTLNTLSALGISDKGGQLEQYISGKNFISEEDLASGKHAGGDDERAKWLTNLSSRAEKLSQELEGKPQAGTDSTYSLTNAGMDQMGQLVDALSRDADKIAAAKIKWDTDEMAQQVTTRASSSALDYSSLVDKGRDERRSTMQSLLEEGFAEGLTFEDMANPNLAQAALGLKGLTNLSEWDDFLTEQFRKANRSGTPASSSTTYRTKAELEGGS